MNASVLALLLATAGCSLYFGDPSARSSGDLGDPGDPGTSAVLPAHCDGPEVDVFGIYEARSDHGGGDHPTGEAGVTIDRPGVHKLVLSAYEPTNWRVTLSPGASVASIYLTGYHAQTVEVPGAPGVPVVVDTFANGRGYACGYSYPYNGEGCDTDQLLARVEAKVGPINTFHGCYHASQWALRVDGSAKSDCDTAAGYRAYELIRGCTTTGGWEKAKFTTHDPASCTGERFVRRDERYDAWVGAIQCGDADHYKLYMSAQRDQAFLQIADYAGHGQDHCELVNPAFTIPNEDDITSGGCTECSVGALVDVIGVPVYARAKFGEPFARVTSREWADLTTTAYACGVSIP
jgi:TARSH-like protein